MWMGFFVFPYLHKTGAKVELDKPLKIMWSSFLYAVISGMIAQR